MSILDSVFGGGCNAFGSFSAQAATCPHGVTDSAYVFSAKQQAKATYVAGSVEIAVMVALALWQRNTSKDIANMQEDIANQQMILAEKMHEHAKKFWVEEKQLVDEAFTETRAATEYDGLSAQFSVLTNDALNQGRMDWIEMSQKACLNPDTCDDTRWQRLTQQSQADVISFAARQAEGRAQVLRNRRFERQYGVLKAGKGRFDPVIGFQNVALNATSSASSALFSSINSAVKETGYWMKYRQPSAWDVRTAGPTLGFKSPGSASQPTVVNVSSPAQTFPVASAGPVRSEALPSSKGDTGIGFKEYAKMLQNTRSGELP